MILVNIMFDGNLMILQFTKVFLKHFLFDIMDLQLNPVGKKRRIGVKLHFLRNSLKLKYGSILVSWFNLDPQNIIFH